MSTSGSYVSYLPNLIQGATSLGLDPWTALVLPLVNLTEKRSRPNGPNRVPPVKHLWLLLLRIFCRFDGWIMDFFQSMGSWTDMIASKSYFLSLFKIFQYFKALSNVAKLAIYQLIHVRIHQNSNPIHTWIGSSMLTRVSWRLETDERSESHDVRKKRGPISWY